MTMLGIPQEVDDREFGVNVLGRFRLLRGMNVVRVPRASQRLLAFLALRGRIVERAALAGALWPEASESHAYSSLRAALSRLQRPARMAVATSPLEVGLAESATVDIHHAKGLARRLLDPAVPPVPGDLDTARSWPCRLTCCPTGMTIGCWWRRRTGGSFACTPWKLSLVISRWLDAGVKRRPPPVQPCGGTTEGNQPRSSHPGFPGRGQRVRGGA